MFNFNYKFSKITVNPRSYFMKNYSSYALLILVSFILTGIVLIYQISLYSLVEKQQTLSFNINRAKELTEITHASDINRSETLYKIYAVNMMQIAEESNSILIVSDLNGKVSFYYDSNNPNIEKAIITDYAVTQTLEVGSYSEVGDLSGYFDDLSYIYSEVVTDQNHDPTAIILISMPATSIIYFILDLAKIFMVVTIIILMLTLIVSYFITSKTTYPLKQISEASLKFAKGDFSIRVPENNNCIEIDNLSKSINYMASSLALSEEKRNTFVENVSHELKTPMTSIGGFVDGILDGTIPHDKQDYYLQIISDEVHRLSRLTVRMLKTSQVQSDTFAIRRAAFDFVETISRVIISFEKKINEKNIDIEVSLDEATVSGDRDNIYQVLYNLTDNAIKFTKPYDKLRISLKVDGTDAFFEISNQSDKINQEKLDNIFDRFYKVDESRSEDTTGAGLGLYIVKKIINLHDSHITVNSENGFTTFAFSLPICESQKKHK